MTESLSHVASAREQVGGPVTRVDRRALIRRGTHSRLDQEENRVPS